MSNDVKFDRNSKVWWQTYFGTAVNRKDFADYLNDYHKHFDIKIADSNDQTTDFKPSKEEVQEHKEANTTDSASSESLKKTFKKKETTHTDLYLIDLDIKINEFLLNELSYQKFEQNIILAVPKELYGYDSRRLLGKAQLSRLFKKYIIKYRGIESILKKSNTLTDKELGKQIRSYLKIN